MNAKGILSSGLARRDAKRIHGEFEKASVASTAISTHAMRRMRRIGWEADRSPSRLGRMGERATQIQDVVVPAATVITAAFTLIAAALELLDRFNKRPEPQGS